MRSLEVFVGIVDCNESCVQEVSAGKRPLAVRMGPGQERCLERNIAGQQ